jgi:hypothetical protein
MAIVKGYLQAFVTYYLTLLRVIIRVNPSFLILYLIFMAEGCKIVFSYLISLNALP